jgi:transposase
MGQIVNCSIDKYNYEKYVETSATIKKKHGEYFLLWKIKKDFNKKHETPKKGSVGGGDFGIRVMLTVYGNNKVVEIGADIQKNFGKRLNTINKVYKRKFSKEKQRRIVGKKFGKMKRMATDLRWKVGKYIADNFETFVMGNFSTKKMGEKGKVGKRTKQIGGLMSQYKLKEVIKYIYARKGQCCKECDEAGTTQCCGKCGYRKRDVGSAKIYACDECKIKIGRDPNSARSMILTSIE